MKSLRKKILASALAMTLVGGIFAPMASAAPKKATEEQIWKDLKITKTLQKVEKGVTTPDAEFEFALTPIGEGNPTIENLKIPFTAADNDDADDTKAGIQVEKTGTFNLSNIKWEKAGIYDYKLKEVIPDSGIKDMDYAYAVDYRGKIIQQGKEGFDGFDIKIKVEEDENGNLVVTGLTVYGKYSKFSGKLNYDDKKGVKFINYYDKKDGNENPGGGSNITEADKKGFAFNKIVKTTDTKDYEKSFDFTVNVEKPASSHSKDTTFSYVVVDEKGVAGGVQTGKYGENVIFGLKTDQRVVFTDVILGSKVSVTEDDSQGLTPSVKQGFFESVDVADTLKNKSVVGYIGDQESGNFAEFTNTNENIPPLTGVLIDNLPYIALVAVAGLGIFFFVKNRREEEIYA